MTRADPRRLLSRRTLRLGIPLLVGFLVLNAPQAYYELLAKGEISPGFLAFWVQYLDFDFEFSIITPTWNHLWYLANLLVYTFLVVALSPVLLPLAAAVLRIWPQRFRHCGPIVLPILPFLAYELLLSDRFPVTHTLIDDWFNHANSLTAMLLGYLAGGGSDLSQALDRFRRPLCWLSLALGALLVFGSTGEAVGVIRVIYGWAVVLVSAWTGQAPPEPTEQSARIPKRGNASLLCPTPDNDRLHWRLGIRLESPSGGRGQPGTRRHDTQLPSGLRIPDPPAVAVTPLVWLADVGAQSSSARH